EERGSVSSTWNTDEPGPAKKVYTLTEAGREELSNWYEDIQVRQRNLQLFLREYESKHQS
ncbi:MAG: helix-turn-helix transcriptional regulator, partial [Firmicutes bacterium]|nr:helix-turn-helix transcriptional regulator [Bacillota bacterium]